MAGKTKHPHPVRKWFLRILLAALAVFLCWFVYMNWFVGRTSSRVSGSAARVELTWEEAMADGVLTDEELAIHYAP